MTLTALAILALAVAFGFVAWGGPGPDRSEAATEAAKPRMDLVINGGQCDSSVDQKCTLFLGDTFSLSVVPSVIPAGGYTGWVTLIDYGNLRYKPTASAPDEMKWDLSLLPVREPAIPTGKEGQIVHANTSGIIPPFPVSFQTTAILSLTMNCASNSKTPGVPFSTVLSMIEYDPVSQPDGTAYLESDLTKTAPNVSSIEINCAAPPTPTFTPLPSTATPTPTSTPTKQPDPGDTDLDGCTDQAENGPNEYLGGQRDYNYFWDFFDVWSHPFGQPTVWVRDKVVNVPGDILGTASRFGPGTAQNKEDALAAALTPPVSDSGYHAGFDRGPVIGPNNWNRAPADGAINIPDDIIGVAVQFGHSCA